MQVGGWYTPRLVPLPSWGKATLICFVSGVVQFVIGLMWQVVWFTEQLSPLDAEIDWHSQFRTSRWLVHDMIGLEARARKCEK